MLEENEIAKDDENPQKLATDLIVGKNRWLIKIRWLYSFFVFIFFVVHNYVAEVHIIDYRAILLALVLSMGGNIIFVLALMRILKVEKPDTDSLESLANMQLDFDLVVLSLLAFFSGGFESPVLVFFIFFIMLSVFVICPEKALKKTFLAMTLVAVIFFSNEGTIDSRSVTFMVGFDVILFFSYLIAAYLARNLKDNEEKIQELLRKFKEQSVTDGLTSLYNQAHFFFLLNMQLEKAKRYHSVFSLVIFDLDNFKNYNDHNGHRVGSEALQQLAQIMKKTFRSSDMLSKYGGDEFVIILPNSDKIGAFLAADRLRENVEKTKFEGGEHQPKGKVTLSLGIASFPEHAKTSRDILDKADKALYFAKESGRNKTVIYNEDVEEFDMANKENDIR